MGYKAVYGEHIQTNRDRDRDRDRQRQGKGKEYSLYHPDHNHVAASLLSSTIPLSRV